MSREKLGQKFKGSNKSGGKKSQVNKSGGSTKNQEVQKSSQAILKDSDFIVQVYIKILYPRPNSNRYPWIKSPMLFHLTYVSEHILTKLDFRSSIR